MPENEKKRRFDEISQPTEMTPTSSIAAPSTAAVGSSPPSPTRPFMTQKTVIFIDWDDTLLCSTFLSGRGLQLDSDIAESDAIHRDLKELEICVSQLLHSAKKFGDVHVVTNAEEGWVELSAKKFIPGVLHALRGIKVLSARSTYEGRDPSPLKWKYWAFQDKLQQYFPSVDHDGVYKNIISFGDSFVEREAVRLVTRGFSNISTKSVKFHEKPSMEQLRRQLELITNCFQYIHSHDGDLDLQLTITKTSDAETPMETDPEGDAIMGQ